MVAAGQVVKTGSVLVVAGLPVFPLFMMLSIVITSSGLTSQRSLKIILALVLLPETECGITGLTHSVSNTTRYEGVVCQEVW